ncbi:hypothetical protein [Anaerovorax sp. IOR16]|uniref:hypothetical protein n=1 Tax=Anaerovorax sp. IOR16 TaxID=2773458 RepID=UPI0019CF506D|nr:hypothetical protein [Anaerovorax sp. IOR16]
MITSNGFNKIANLIKETISHGTYQLNGSTKTTQIYKTSVEANVLKIYLYFDDVESGSFSKFQLVDTDGNVFAEKPDNISKPNTKGLLVLFKFTITEVR